jgi:hypothetical protein
MINIDEKEDRKNYIGGIAAPVEDRASTVTRYNDYIHC